MWQDIHNLARPLLSKGPFLISLKEKKHLMNMWIENFRHLIEISYIKLSRDKLLESLTNAFRRDPNLGNSGGNEFIFEFGNEMGRGPGVTKEFYLLYSEQIRRSDHNLWLGESREINGEICSHMGLYPSPLRASDEPSVIMEHFFMLGVIVAKSIQDNQILDIPFNEIFLKWLICSDDDTEFIDIDDLKEVCPDYANFITSLENVVREKEKIKSNPDLSEEQMKEAMSNLMIDGNRIDEMSLDFTLPGYPDIEMKENGANIPLSSHNVDEYLELLALWFLRQGPAAKLQAFKKGFESVMKTSLICYFYPYQLKSIICGENFRTWTRDELASNCRLEEQEAFLQFTTSSTKLPSGGLKSLRPPLTIYCPLPQHVSIL